MIQSEKDAREALAVGKVVKLVLDSETKSPKNLFLIPCNSIENETRTGILISLESRGSFFYTGILPLRALALVQNGFMPADAVKSIKALKQIFPEVEDIKSDLKPKANPNQLKLTQKRHERNGPNQKRRSKSSGKPRASGKPKSSKPKSGSRRKTPTPKNG